MRSVPRVFISHAVADLPLIKDLRKLLQSVVGLQPNLEIFQSSAPGAIPPGTNFAQYIRSELDDSTFVVAVVTPAYLESQFCMAELGAVWFSAEKDFFPICAPGVDFGDLNGTLLGIQAARLDERPAVADLLQRVAKHFNREYYAATADDEMTTFEVTLAVRLADLQGPTRVPASKVDELEAKLATLGQALVQAQDAAAKQEETIAEVIAAKSAAEAEERARAVDDSVQLQIKELVAEARYAVGQIPVAVAKTLPDALRGVSSPLPDDFGYDLDAVVEQLREGLLNDDGDKTVSPNTDFPEVKRALDAVSELDLALRGLDEDDEVWFTEEYGVPPKLEHLRVFRRLMGIRT